jgi:hypothetical protein
MEKKTQNIITQIALAAAVIVLQVLSIRISYFQKPLVMNLEYGLESIGFTLLMEGLSLLSGIVLTWLPDIRPQKEISHKEVNVGFLLLFIFTILLVVSKVLMLGLGWSKGFLYDLLSPFKPFGEWVLFTTNPSLLAGFSLGKLLRR